MNDTDTAKILTEFFHEHGYETKVQWGWQGQMAFLGFDHTESFITISGTKISFGRGQFSEEQEFDLNHPESLDRLLIAVQQSN